MGALLDKPEVDKETWRGSARGLSFGASAMQGWRRDMEDSHTVIMELPELPDHSWVAVYDGHGGKLAAQLAGGVGDEEEGEVIVFLRAQPAYKEYIALPAATRGEAAGLDLLSAALEGAFLGFEAALEPKLTERVDTSGCTAVACVITPTHLVCANAGDSRACYCTDGEGDGSAALTGARAVALSYDHKPTNAEEQARIEAAGGSVSMQRVDGSLAVSRAFGDFSYKDPALPPPQQKVTAQPEIVRRARDPRDQLLVLACDGIWDVKTNDSCCALLRTYLGLGESDMGLVCEELLDVCLDEGSRCALPRPSRAPAVLRSPPELAATAPSRPDEAELGVRRAQGQHERGGCRLRELPARGGRGHRCDPGGAGEGEGPGGGRGRC